MLQRLFVCFEKEWNESGSSADGARKRVVCLQRCCVVHLHKTVSLCVYSLVHRADCELMWSSVYRETRATTTSLLKHMAGRKRGDDQIM